MVRNLQPKEREKEIVAARERETALSVSQSATKESLSSRMGH